MLSVTGRIRVARPPARIATGGRASADVSTADVSTGNGATGGAASPTMLLRHHLRALEVEMVPHFGQAGLTHGAAKPHLILSIEHQEAAAARADELAADGAVRPGQ